MMDVVNIFYEQKVVGFIILP